MTYAARFLRQRNWHRDSATVYAVAEWAVENREVSTAKEMLEYFATPWSWQEWFEASGV